MTGKRVRIAIYTGAVIRRDPFTIFESWLVRLDTGETLSVSPRDMEVIR